MAKRNPQDKDFADLPPARVYAIATIKTYSTTVLLKLNFVGPTADLDLWEGLVVGLDLWLSKRYGLALLTESKVKSDPEFEVVIADEALEIFAQRLKEALPQSSIKQVDRIGERVYGISELSPVWFMEKPVQPPSPVSAERPEAKKNARSTLVYYLYTTHKGKTMLEWCDAVGDIKPRTCSDHKKKGQLLTPEKFQLLTGETLEDAALRIVAGDQF